MGIQPNETFEISYNLKKKKMEHFRKKETGESPINKHKLLMCIQKRGKIIYGSEFRIFTKIRSLLTELIPYFTNNESIANCYKLNTRKGILLIGKPQSGKTAIMFLINHLFKIRNQYTIKSCLEIVSVYKKYGYTTLTKISHNNQKKYCFDDFGLEPAVEKNIIKSIIESKLIQPDQIVVHVITSLSLYEIEKRYGSDFLELLKQNLNILIF